MATPSTSVRFRSRILAVLTATALLATASCGGSGSKGAGTQELAIAIQGAPRSFDITQLSSGQDGYIWSALYDTLLYTDNDGQIQPNAARSYSYSDDRKTLTLKLRKGMTFSSGAPVNAAAVKASLERISGTAGPNQEGLTSVETVEAPDEHTVVIRLEQPDGALLTQLSWSSGVIADPKTMKRPSAATDPVGSGPYTLADGATVSGSTYVLEKRDGHWNADAYPFERVKVRVMTDRSAVTNALQAGQLNAGTVDFTQLAAVKEKGLKTTSVKASTVATMVLADREGAVNPALGDVRVRRAINMAFHRKKLVKTFLHGSGQPTGQLFNPKKGAYDAELDKSYSYDVAAAERLLAEAGYPNGFSVTMPSLATTKAFEPTIAQSLAEIGIEVTWEPVPPQQQAAALFSKKYPMFLWLEGLHTDGVTVDKFLSRKSQRNPFSSSDTALAKLIDEAAAAADPAAADAAYRKVNEFLVDKAWFAPVLFSGMTWATADGVTYLGDGSTLYSRIRTFGVGR